MQYALRSGVFILLAAVVMFPLRIHAAEIGDQWPSWIGRIDGLQQLAQSMPSQRSAEEWPDVPPEYRSVSYEMYLRRQQQDTSLPPRIVNTGTMYNIEKAPELWPQWIGLPPWYRK